MKIEKLRKLAGKEEIDYQFLMSALSEYARPRDKISAWLRVGDLIRVKKGLYIFGHEVALTAYSKEVLANLIYGPSAISLAYALAFYGFIPERLTTVTSITSKRNKTFSTPVGVFTYQYLNTMKYSIGIELVNVATNRAFFIASPEKALSDYIHLIDKKIQFATLEEVEIYLLHDLRIEENALSTLRINKLDEIQKIYHDERITLLTQFIKKWKKR